ncbi:MAG: MmgE/PrpD family protein [Parvibaculaceae bacterium]|nr:MmgE/PrpD family protein [Parvibaculaceae bacterium]
MMATANRPTTDPEGVTGTLSAWLAQLSLDDVPEAVRERAKYLLLDGIGCAFVGAKLPWSALAVEAVTRFEGRGEKTIIGWGRTTAGPAAALLNGTFIQGFELDDFHPLGPLHSASLIIPSLLACAEELENVSGSAFLLGAIKAFEVGPRVGMALHGAEMLSRGWHSGAVFGTHASAVAAGSLLGLDPAGYEDALGLAGTQSAGLMAAQYEAMCKRMHHGMASRNGLYAAHLAAAGYTGIKRVFEREYGGFLSVFGEGHAPDSSQITRELGESWETQRIVVKPYAAMGALHAPLDALFEIAARRPLRADEIVKVDVDMSHAAYHHGWWKVERPLEPIGAQMNVAYALAVAILDGAAMVAQFSPQRIAEDDVWALIPKIEAHHDAGFDKAGATSRGATRVRIRFTDGTTEECFTAVSRGILSPIPGDEVLAKFRTLTRDIVDSRRIGRIEDCVLNIERLGDLKELTGLLAEPVEPVFR